MYFFEPPAGPCPAFTPTTIFLGFTTALYRHPECISEKSA
jgi:hypothetical protein